MTRKAVFALMIHSLISIEGPSSRLVGPIRRALWILVLAIGGVAVRFIPLLVSPTHIIDP